MLLLLLLVLTTRRRERLQHGLQEGGEHRGGRHLACVEVGLDEGVLRHEEKEERSGSGGVGLPASCAAQSRQPRAPVRHWYSGVDAFACPNIPSFLPSFRKRERKSKVTTARRGRGKREKQEAGRRGLGARRPPSRIARGEITHKSGNVKKHRRSGDFKM